MRENEFGLLCNCSLLYVTSKGLHDWDNYQSLDAWKTVDNPAHWATMLFDEVARWCLHHAEYGKLAEQNHCEINGADDQSLQQYLWHSSMEYSMLNEGCCELRRGRRRIASTPAHELNHGGRGLRPDQIHRTLSDL